MGVANWPIGIAYCVPFRGYHLEHHKWQGVDGIDTDIPSRFEGKYVRGPVLKAIWCCCQILTYALRPMFIKAQDFTPNHLYNWISQIAFDLVVFYFWGYKPLAYFVLCIFLAHVERRLPQRAPRLLQRAVVAAARAQEVRAGVLRQPRCVTRGAASSGTISCAR